MDAGLFNGDLEVGEDWDLFVRVAEKYPVRAIDEPLIYYRLNNNGRHFHHRKEYVRVSIKILTDLYHRQGLLPTRQREFDRAVAVIHQKAGIQSLNAGLPSEARKYFYHPKCAPLRWQFKMIGLKFFSLLPSRCYDIALRILDSI